MQSIINGEMKKFELNTKETTTFSVMKANPFPGEGDKARRIIELNIIVSCDGFFLNF